MSFVSSATARLKRQILSSFVILCIGFAGLVRPAHAADGRFLYIESNHIAEGQNSILAYKRQADGRVTLLPGSPFLTGGTGMNNDTHGKLGPDDNDTPIALSEDGRLLFAVNTHSNTIAVFNILDNGSLRHVKGSPFPSRGIAPNSLSVSENVLLVSNRNGDYHQLDKLRGAAKANYVSFRVNDDGSLTFLSAVDVEGGHKPTQVFFSTLNRRIAFGNDFQVDADFDGDGKRSWLAGHEQIVQGQLHVFKLDERGHLVETDRVTLPETDPGHLYKGLPGVPSLPLGIWDHPKKNLLYVGFVTRNELGVYRYTHEGRLTFMTSVPNGGQDICWLLANRAGTRLYAVNNLNRKEAKDKAGSISIYDISGEKAERPVEIGRVQTPFPGEYFINNRMFSQPGSTPFQMDLDPTEDFLYVINQRINQMPENKNTEGNFLHIFKVEKSGLLTMVDSRDLRNDGVPSNSRPQGVVTLDR
jgi:6-phosphogluconolactonase (cycloisomerase 2 family)